MLSTFTPKPKQPTQISEFLKSFIGLIKISQDSFLMKEKGWIESVAKQALDIMSERKEKEESSVL